MSLRFEILGILSYGENSGYTLTKKINSSAMFFWNAQQSQVYRELQKLEADELIVPKSDNTEYKKVYEITPIGKEFLIEWLNKKETLESLEIRNPLVMKLFFSYIADRSQTIEMLEDYKIQCKNMVEEIASGQDDLMDLAQTKQERVFFSLNSYYGVGFYNFSIEWAEKCIGVLKKLENLDQ
ncbi:MAG: PadR family transcriptional regulator [Oscillospiraceae bacterium]